MKRRIYQGVSLLILHASWLLPQAKWLCNPVLSCHSCSLSVLACPIGVLVHYSGYQIFPFIAVGTLLFLGVLLGRLLCGWVCPFGLIQDLLYQVPSRKFRLPQWTNNTKYLVLILLVFVLPYYLGETSWGSFCRYCPAAAWQVRLPAFIGSGLAGDFQLTATTIVKFSILAVVIAGAIASCRSFCRVLCPIGALLAPLNYLSFWVVRPTGNECISCAGCDKACITDVKPSARLDHDVPANRALDCVVCHECTAVCRKVHKARAAPATAE